MPIRSVCSPEHANQNRHLTPFSDLMKNLIFAAVVVALCAACSDSTAPKNDCYLKPKTRVPVCNFDF